MEGDGVKMEGRESEERGIESRWSEDGDVGQAVFSG
jgi:hypothetical protein